MSYFVVSHFLGFSVFPALPFFPKRGGAFAEWDFLRGVEEGWIPPIPDPTISSESLYGSCYDIVNRTTEDYASVVQEFPDPRTLDWKKWQGWDFDDDFVLNDGQGMIREPYHHHSGYRTTEFWLGTLLVAVVGTIFLVKKYHLHPKASGYEELK
jgi:hypothetical protein